MTRPNHDLPMLAVNQLPDPREHADADVVIYDGKCVFCQGQVRNLKRFDGANRLAFVSLHDPWVTESWPDLTHEELMKQIYVVSRDDNEKFGGANAIRYLSRRLPKLWVVAPLMHIPFSLPFWQWGYNLVANQRYKIANKNGTACDDDGTCQLHFGDQNKDN